MKSRRDFLRQSTLILAGGLLAPNLFGSNMMPSSGGKNIGIQLYSLREMISKDGIQKVLELLSKIGYKNLELAGYSDGKVYGLDPVGFKKRIGDLGMKCTSTHVGHSYSKEKEAEIMSWWDKAIETHHKIGCKYMVQASMPVNDKSPLDDLKTYCDYFSAIGEKTADAGMTFGYHNHTVEFKKIGDQVILDYMLDHVNKKKVIFELDVYWCQEGGANPVEYLKKYPNQFKLTHIKDDKEIGASGKMDFASIFNQMNANRIKDWYVEIEQYTHSDALGVQQSFDFLNEAAFVK